MKNNTRIVAIGDSVTQGFPYGEEYSWTTIVSSKYKTSIINRGICGDYTSGMLERFYNDVITEKPDAVIILGGYNDAFSEIPTRKVAANFQEMCILAKENDIIPLVGLPTPVSIDFIEELLSSYREATIKISKEESIKTIDFYNTFIDLKSGDILPGTTTDGAHPTIKGYKLMAEAVVFKDLLPDYF